MELNFTLSELITIGAMLITVAGVILTNKSNNQLLNSKLEQLEKKQDKHNNLIERQYKVEESCKVAHNRIKTLKEDIKDETNEIKEKIDQVLGKFTDYVVNHKE